VKRFSPAPEVCDCFRCELLGVFVSFHHSSLAVYRIVSQVKSKNGDVVETEGEPPLIYTL